MNGLKRKLMWISQDRNEKIMSDYLIVNAQIKGYWPQRIILLFPVLKPESFN